MLQKSFHEIAFFKLGEQGLCLSNLRREQEKYAFNPKTQEESTCLRNEIMVDMELPMGDDHSEYIEKSLVARR